MKFLKKIIMFSIYLLAWFYLLPNLNEEYQFLFKVFLMSLPLLFGIQQFDEIQEFFIDSKTHKKIIGQLVHLQNKSSLAIIYNDGTIEFVSDSVKTEKKKNQVENKKKLNWWNKI